MILWPNGINDEFGRRGQGSIYPRVIFFYVRHSTVFAFKANMNLNREKCIFTFSLHWRKRFEIKKISKSNLIDNSENPQRKKLKMLGFEYLKVGMVWLATIDPFPYSGIHLYTLGETQTQRSNHRDRTQRHRNHRNRGTHLTKQNPFKVLYRSRADAARGMLLIVSVMSHRYHENRTDYYVDTSKQSTISSLNFILIWSTTLILQIDRFTFIEFKFFS